MRSWPKRRWVTAALATPVIAAAMASFGWPAGTSPAVMALTVGAAVLGGLIVASYVPVTGRGVDLGCGSCAVMSGFTVLGGLVAMNTYPGSLLGPFGAAMLMAFGLTQRLTQPATCAAPVRVPATTTEEPAPSEELSDR